MSKHGQNNPHTKREETPSEANQKIRKLRPELVFINTMQETAVVPTESSFLRVDSKVNSFLGYTAVFMKKG